MRARDRSGREQAQGRELRARTDEAVELALSLVDTLEPGSTDDVGIDIVFASPGDAVFARKRLNEALAVRELVDEVEAWVWQADRHVSAPLTDAGRETGVEMRLRRRM